jgi:hypothetical protein
LWPRVAKASDARVKRALHLCAVGASFVLLAQACGSDDGKKAVPGKTYQPGGGEGGEASGGKGGKGGTAGSGGTETLGGKSGSDGGAPFGGSTATGATGGTPSGDAGAGGEPVIDACPAGFGECDDDASTVCEQALTLITSCGACDAACNPTNGTPLCTDGKCEYDCATGYGDCDADGENGCEASFSDDEHCGSCDRNCAAAGATCTASKQCSPINLQQSQPISGDNSGNRTWAFSPLGLLQAPFYSYAVRRYPLDGSSTKVVYDSTNKTLGMESLLVVGNDVYWSQQGTGGDDFTSAVYKKAITAAAGDLPTLVFAPEWKATFLRKQGNAFYWFSGDYQSGDPVALLYTRAFNAAESDPGTKIMTVDQGTHNGMEAFDVTSNALYWISNKALTGTAYELRTTPLSGGTPSVVPAVSGAFPTKAVSRYLARPALYPVGDTLYFNRNASDAADGIYKYKTGDAAPQPVVLGDNIMSLVVDEQYVYYTRQNLSGIWRAKISGSAGTQIADAPIIKIVGHDAQFVYALASGPGSGESSLYKVIK